jgi:hypothetical protein
MPQNHYLVQIFVDATNGKILLNDAIIKHADANGKDKIAKTIKPKTNTLQSQCRMDRLELLLQDQKI